MPRQSRIVIPNIAHHITQRGNYGRNVFSSDEDYKIYLRWFTEYTNKYKLDVLAYCLMRNHVHFIVVPKREESLSRIYNTLHMRYAQYINRMSKERGHLWQGRFYSCLLDDKHLYRAIRYVERNPVRAGMVKKAWEYKWSSARCHMGEEGKGMVSLSESFDMGRKEWMEYLSDSDNEMVGEIRLKTQRGLAVGTDNFIKKIENKIKRSLKYLNQGRPSKKR